MVAVWPHYIASDAVLKLAFGPIFWISQLPANLANINLKGENRITCYGQKSHLIWKMQMASQGCWDEMSRIREDQHHVASFCYVFKFVSFWLSFFRNRDLVELCHHPFCFFDEYLQSVVTGGVVELFPLSFGWLTLDGRFARDIINKKAKQKGYIYKIYHKWAKTLSTT